MWKETNEKRNLEENVISFAIEIKTGLQNNLNVFNVRERCY